MWCSEIWRFFFSCSLDRASINNLQLVVCCEWQLDLGASPCRTGSRWSGKRGWSQWARLRNGEGQPTQWAGTKTQPTHFEKRLNKRVDWCPTHTSPKWYINIQKYMRRDLSCLLWQYRLHSITSTSPTVNMFAIKARTVWADTGGEEPQQESSQHWITAGTRNHVETRRNMTCYGPLCSCLGHSKLLRKKRKKKKKHTRVSAGVAIFQIWAPSPDMQGCS